MSNFFILLLLASLFAIVISLVNPKWTMPWATAPKRLHGVGLCIAATVICFVGFGLTHTPNTEADETTQNSPEETPLEEIANSPVLEEKAIEAAITMLETAPPSRWLAMDRSEEAQAERQELIQRAIDMGLIYKVEKPAKYPRIYVDNGWNLLRFDEKQSLANAITTYYYAQDHEVSMAIIRDGYTGNNIGRIDSTGLNLH